ncbi:hypothetical protein OCH80_06210 [Lactobacillus sp. 23-2]|uniref:hypothetical protein n=1 Tax=Lactobacillus sp. 23-2 TaxID=2981842 RepID=UPI003839B88A
MGIVLVGFMACGKTTIGELLAKRQGGYGRGGDQLGQPADPGCRRGLAAGLWADRDRARKILAGHFPEVGQN